MLEFNTFVSVLDLPIDGVIHARIADDVLDEDMWNTYALTISKSIVVGQLSKTAGVYSYTNFLGWTTLQLADWSSRDCTGSHPENFYELATV